jgi:hypothetical protein
MVQAFNEMYELEGVSMLDIELKGFELSKTGFVQYMAAAYAIIITDAAEKKKQLSMLSFN